MRAGTLNQRVTLQSKSATRDSMGNEVITWATVAELWAGVEPIRGREFVSLRSGQSDLTTKITIRYRAGVTPLMRILHEGAVYDVREVINPRSKNDSLELMCVAEAV